MTEPIIVNGVEVSECKRFYINASHPERLECIDPYNKGFCKDNPNCCYKSLKRKEQECNELLECVEDLEEDIQILKKKLNSDPFKLLLLNLFRRNTRK